MELTIEKNIPLSERTLHPAEKSALSRMQIGDSFLYHYKHKDITRVQAYHMLRTIARSLKIEIATRKNGDNMRIWRVK